LLAWIGGSRKGEAPIIGSLPNRFEASADDPKTVARSDSKAIQDKWDVISQAVWTKFVADVAENGRDTKKIWDRQVNGFWEVSWVIGSDISAMNSRKNWRINRLTDEAGDHCTIMGDWQELSGFIRSKHEDRIKEDDFWKDLRSQSKLGRLDIRDGERLCALALIKRLFPKVSEDAIGWLVETNNWPSTPYVSAVPWLKEVIDKVPREANDYARDVVLAAPDAQRPGISRKMGSFGSNLSEPFLNLDGNFYFENALVDCKRTPLEGTPVPLEKGKEEPDDVKNKRGNLKGLLKGLARKVDSSPVSFYAMLLMDGDNMGKLIGEHQGESISKALSIFTKGVRTIVGDHNGVTIYAGGDDVLAMLPMLDAFKCALSLSKKYVQSFREAIPEAQATISAGLVFSHYHIPLSTVMQEAHHILDDVAKDENGRDSIAVSVLKTSGKHCQWTVTWDRLTDNKGVSRIDDLVSKVQDGPQKQFSTSFFYGMRDYLAILSGDQLLKPGSYARLVEVAV
jgi:CRISPR-associated protein Cmr2